MIAKVIVNIPSSNIDQLFDYLIPPEFCDFASVGSRVRVPFGDANRQIMGFIIELKDESTYIGDLKENITIYLFIQKTPTSGAWNLVVPVVKGDESKRFLEFALGSFALQGCGGGLNNTDTLFYYLEKHINKGYNVTILPKVIESTYLDDFQYLDSNVKIETLLENSIDLINYRKGKLDWIFKEYIRLSNKYSLV